MLDFVWVKSGVKRLILNVKRNEMGIKKSPIRGPFCKYRDDVNSSNKNCYSADTSNSTSVE